MGPAVETDSDVPIGNCRPNADPKKVEQARRELANGIGVLKTAKLVGLGTGTGQRLKQSIAVAQSHLLIYHTR